MREQRAALYAGLALVFLALVGLAVGAAAHDHPIRTYTEGGYTFQLVSLGVVGVVTRDGKQVYRTPEHDDQFAAQVDLDGWRDGWSDAHPGHGKPGDRYRIEDGGVRGEVSERSGRRVFVGPKRETARAAQADLDGWQHAHGLDPKPPHGGSDPEPTSPPGQNEVPRKGSMPFAHTEVDAPGSMPFAHTEVGAPGSMPFAHTEVDAPVVPPLSPGLTRVIAVDYPRTLDQSMQWLTGAGFQDVRGLGYYHPPDYPWLRKRGTGDNQVPCNLARKLVRQLDREGQATSFYIGDFDWSDSRCNLYVFSSTAYIGPPGNLGRDAP